MRFDVGDKVKLRLVKDNHLHEKKEGDLTATGTILEVHEDHRWYLAEYRFYSATHREAFKPEDVARVY